MSNNSSLFQKKKKFYFIIYSKHNCDEMINNLQHLQNLLNKMHLRINSINLNYLHLEYCSQILRAILCFLYVLFCAVQSA